MNEDFKEAQESVKRLQQKFEDFLKLLERRRIIARRRNWLCMGVGWLAALVAFFLTPRESWAVLVCFGASFSATLVAYWISDL